MVWLEISLTVTPELAESVADVLARFAPGGVVTESTAIRPTPAGEGEPTGPVIVRAYLPQDDQIEDKRARLAESLWHLGQLAAQSGLAVPPPAYRTLEEADWSEKWKEHYQPIRIGRRLVVIPSWLNVDLARGDVPVRLDPGLAFGTGTHPTTQLCLAAIEQRLRPGDSALDLGAGSGILAIAAAKLGASAVLALDTDSEAVRAARENVAANGVTQTVRVESGSLAQALALGAWDLVVANILSSVIIQLLGKGLAETVAPGGILILSGILEDQAEEVVKAVRQAGLEVEGKTQMGEWVAVLASRPASGFIDQAETGIAPRYTRCAAKVTVEENRKSRGGVTRRLR